MNDLLEQSLREALSERAAQVDPASLTRLRAVDYHPRRRRLGTLPTLGAVGMTGVAAAVTAVVILGSGAAPAFAGWQPTPTTPAAGQLAQAAQACGQGLGTPVLTDSRGPYTAAIYADSTTSHLCLSGNGVSMAQSQQTVTAPQLAAGQVELAGDGTRDSAGDDLTLVDGRTGAGVTAVTIERSDGSSVQATVVGGWYLAWWPGTVAATSAEVTTASGTSTESFPSTPALPAPSCPSGARCSSGYGFSAGPGGQSTSGVEQQGSTSLGSGSSSTTSGQ
jgi:hypothetical protein